MGVHFFLSHFISSCCRWTGGKNCRRHSKLHLHNLQYQEHCTQAQLARGLLQRLLTLAFALLQQYLQISLVLVQHLALGLLCCLLTLLPLEVAACGPASAGCCDSVENLRMMYNKPLGIKDLLLLSSDCHMKCYILSEVGFALVVLI